MYHDAVRKGRYREVKHTQDHNVFEVALLGEVKTLTKVRSKWLQDMKGNAAKARFVAQLVAYGERDDVLRLLAHCCCWQPAETRKKPGTSDCMTQQQRSSTHQETSSLFSFCQLGLSSQARDSY